MPTFTQMTAQVSQEQHLAIEASSVDAAVKTFPSAPLRVDKNSKNRAKMPPKTCFPVLPVRSLRNIALSQGIFGSLSHESAAGDTILTNLKRMQGKCGFSSPRHRLHNHSRAQG